MDGFFKVNIGNVIAWALVIGGWMLAWQKLRDKVESMSEEFHQLREDVKDLRRNGPVASDASLRALSDRVENYHLRLHTVEDSQMEMKNALVEIRNDTKWIKEAVKKQNGH